MSQPRDGGVWETDWETGEQIRRLRPETRRFKEIPRSIRRAEVLCSLTPQRPTIVAIVIGAPTMPTDLLLIRPADHSMNYQVGQDFVTTCRCGRAHDVDGRLLRAALLADDASGKTRTIDVSRVERSAGDTAAL